MSSRTHRRAFLRCASLAGIGVWTSGSSVGAEKAPSDKLNLAFVGAAGRGLANLDALKGQNAVALCDADQRRIGPAVERCPKARRFEDFRRMFDQAAREIDAVVVSAPNHIHAPASVMAMRLGKHVYCEKPLAHSVYEARVMAQVAAEKKVATQMGTQIHASDNYRRAIEILESGAIGTVREVDVWTTAAEGGGDRPTDTPPIPRGLNWDVWIGPAPARPYHSCYLPRQWHFWWDFGGGVMGNVGCHFMDLPFWAMKLRHPTTIEAEGPTVHSETTPRTMIVRYDYPARANLSPLKLTWYQGRKSPRVETAGALPWDTAFLFVGDKGMLQTDYSRRVLLPEKQFAGFQPPPPTISGSPGHYAEWIASCKTGSATGCNFDYAGALTEAMLLGNVAYRAGKKIAWDPAALRCKDCPEADVLLRRDYRPGWTL